MLPVSWDLLTRCSTPYKCSVPTHPAIFPKFLQRILDSSISSDWSICTCPLLSISVLPSHWREYTVAGPCVLCKHCGFQYKMLTQKHLSDYHLFLNLHYFFVVALVEKLWLTIIYFKIFRCLLMILRIMMYCEPC